MIKSILKNEKIVFWSLAICVVFTAGFYIYFMNNAILNVVRRSAAEENISALEREAAQLESEYLASSNEITVELAYSLGYKEANPTYIAKRSVSIAEPEKLQ